MPRNGNGLVSLGEEPQRHDAYSRLISLTAPVFLSNTRSLEAQMVRSLQSCPANELAPCVNAASPLDVLHPPPPPPNQWRRDLVSSLRSCALPRHYIIFLSCNWNQDLFRDSTTEPRSTLLCFKEDGDNSRA